MKRMIFSIFSIVMLSFAAGQLAWMQANNNGFGDEDNSGTSSMAVYDECLYVGTWNDSSGTEIWKYDGRTWMRANTDGFEDRNNSGTSSMAVYDECLYVGTESYTGTEIWKYDGRTWMQANTDGFEDGNKSSFSMAVYDECLYVGTENDSTGTEIWKYDGRTWMQANTDGFGNRNNTFSLSMAVYDECLYVGTENDSTGTEIWKYDGKIWTQVETGCFWDVNNTLSFSMAVYDECLYVGTENDSTGTEIWKYDGRTWMQANTDGFGDENNSSAFSMAVYEGNLYVGTWNDSSGTEIWKYDGRTWKQANTDGFEDENNILCFSMAVYDEYLYVGTWNYTGTEIWRALPTQPPATQPPATQPPVVERAGMEIGLIDMAEIIVAIITAAGIVYSAESRKTKQKEIKKMNIIMAVCIILLITSLFDLGSQILFPSLDISLPNTPPAIDADEILNIQVTVSSKGDPVSNAKVLVKTEGGWFEDTETTQTSGSTTKDGTFLATWHPFGPSAYTEPVRYTFEAEASKSFCRSGSGKITVVINPKDVRPPSIPRLISPVNGATISNQPINWSFDWSDSTDDDSGVNCYHICMKDPHGRIQVSTNVTESHYAYTREGYIREEDLNGWTWKVRVQDNEGNWSEWSELRTFNVSLRSPVYRFVGTWTSEDPETSEITHVEIRIDQGTVFVHMWGKCQPTDCDWGEKTTSISDAVDGTIELMWHQELCVRVQELSILPDGRLQICEHTYFTDGSSQFDCFIFYTEELAADECLGTLFIALLVFGGVLAPLKHRK